MLKIWIFMYVFCRFTCGAQGINSILCSLICKVSLLLCQCAGSVSVDVTAELAILCYVHMWLYWQSDWLAGLKGNQPYCVWEMTCNRLLLPQELLISNSLPLGCSPPLERIQNRDRKRLIDWLKKMPGGYEWWSKKGFREMWWFRELKEIIHF